MYRRFRRNNTDQALQIGHHQHLTQLQLSSSEGRYPYHKEARPQEKPRYHFTLAEKTVILSNESYDDINFSILRARNW